MKCYNCEEYDNCKLAWKDEKDLAFCTDYKQKHTNEKWFNGLSTIEKAKALHKLHWEMQNHFDYHPDEEDYVEEYCLCWLKTVHRDD